MNAVFDALNALRAGLRQAVSGGAPQSSPATTAGQRIFDRLETRNETSNAVEPVRLPVCQYLGQALATARRGPACLGVIADAFERIEPHLAWYRRVGSDALGAPFHDGHGNALIVGPGGLEERTDVWVGASLMAPDVVYPDHQHPPEEVYVVLSSGEWRQDDGSWVEPGVGGIHYNPPGIVHAMRAGSAPLFAIWLLNAVNDQGGKGPSSGRR